MGIVQINRHAPCVQGFRPQMLATNLAVPLFFRSSARGNRTGRKGLSTGPEQSFPFFYHFAMIKKKPYMHHNESDLTDCSIVTE